MWYSPPLGKNRTMITRTCNSTFGIHDDSFPLHHLWHVNFFSAAWIPSSRTLFLLVDNRSESYWEEFRLALPSSVTTNRSILDFQVIGVPENGRPMTYFNASWLMTMYSSRYCDHLWHIDTYGWTFKLGICTQVSKSIRCRRFPQRVNGVIQYHHEQDVVAGASWCFSILCHSFRTQAYNLGTGLDGILSHH